MPGTCYPLLLSLSSHKPVYPPTSFKDPHRSQTCLSIVHLYRRQRNIVSNAFSFRGQKATVRTTIDSGLCIETHEAGRLITRHVIQRPSRAVTGDISHNSFESLPPRPAAKSSSY